MSAEIDVVLLYNLLENQYNRLEPHHETWELWLKHHKTEKEFFEVAIGTILVQNTNWRNVDRSINNLIRQNITSFNAIKNTNLSKITDLIRPSGFYNQKSIYLLALSEFFLEKQITTINDLSHSDTYIKRQDLLGIKGVGNETADSLLNFCLRQPVAIVGTYTRRLLSRIFNDPLYKQMKYRTLKTQIEAHLEPDPYTLGKFHAQIVCHCQNFCYKKRPDCQNCFLQVQCAWNSKL